MGAKRARAMGSASGGKLLSTISVILAVTYDGTMQNLFEVLGSIPSAPLSRSARDQRARARGRGLVA